MDKMRTGLKGYFAGDNLSDMAKNMGMSGVEGTSAAMRRRRMLTRRGVAAGVGAYVAGKTLFGSDNAVTTTAGTGLALGGHGAVMGLIGSAYPVAGAAYGAWSGLNMLRPGNNLGPF